MDIIVPHGWFEQPASGPTTVPWKFHQARSAAPATPAANSRCTT